MKTVTDLQEFSSLTRRSALKAAATAAAAVFAAPMINIGRYQLFAHQPTQYSARCVKLMQESLVIDMLSPLTIEGKWAQWATNPESFKDADFKRYKDSGINVFHHAFGLGGTNAYESALSYFATINSLIAGNDQTMMRIDSAADFKRVKGSGKMGVLAGIQNAEHFRRPQDVTFFFGLGQRVSQLTYNSRNLIGNGSTERRDEGISDFGASIVDQMNKTGMAIDVSHCGDRTTLDAFELSKKPVLITHSNCRALAPGHPRCKSDDAIKACGKAGGVMGITSVRNFVKNSEPTTIEDVINHFDHVKKLIGPQHLGVGSDIDLDGYDDMDPAAYQRLKAAYKDSYSFRDKIDIEGLDHPKRMFDLTEGLIRRGYSDAEIIGILGGNFARVLSEIWPANQSAP
ncbi:MAG: membrane dipeptidase [Gemmatimonadota bacterium]